MSEPTLTVHQNGVTWEFDHQPPCFIPHVDFVKRLLDSGCQRAGLSLSLVDRLFFLPMAVCSYLLFLASYSHEQIDEHGLIEAVKKSLTVLLVVVCLSLGCVLPSAMAQTSTSIVQDGRLVDITIPGDASLEQLKEIRLISKDVLTILEKQLDHEETKANHADIVNAVFWYALLISPLLALTWLLYKVKKLHVQHTQQQTLYVESRQALSSSHPLVMLSPSQALERRV
jgi:hypothetical protein